MNRARSPVEKHPEEKDSKANQIKRPAEAGFQVHLPAVQKVLSTPGILTPSQVCGMQPTVGNRAVQRIVARRAQPGIVQRHVPPHVEGLDEKVGVSILDRMDQLKQIAGGLDKDVDGLAYFAHEAKTYECEAPEERGFQQTSGAAVEEEQGKPPIPATGGV